MEKRERKLVDPEARIGIGKFFAWESRELSDAAMAFFAGYVALFCTDVIKVSPLTIGTVAMATKIIDAITDILAGYIVDRTNTRFGKGRPYDFCLPATWISLILLFACPVSWSEGAKIAYVALFSTLSSAVFTTLLNAGETVFMLRAFNKKQLVRFTAYGGLVTSIGGLVVGIIIPQLINKAGSDPQKWIQAVAVVGVPLALIGMCRFIFVKERPDAAIEKEEKEPLRFADIFSMLKHNKYILLYFLITLVSTSFGGVTIFYFKVVIGNLGVQSLFAAFSSLAVIALVVLPALMKRFTIKQILMGGLLIAMVTDLVGFIFYRNLPVLIAGYVIKLMATVPGTYINKIIFYDNAAYNEFLGLRRLEGLMGSVHGFMKRLGSAFASFIGGVLLTVIQYDPDAVTVSQFTINGLRVGQFIIPAVVLLIQFILWRFYDLEKKLPEVNEELAKRRAEAVQN